MQCSGVMYTVAVLVHTPVPREYTLLRLLVHRGITRTTVPLSYDLEKKFQQLYYYLSPCSKLQGNPISFPRTSFTFPGSYITWTFLIYQNDWNIECVQKHGNPSITVFKWQTWWDTELPDSAITFAPAPPNELLVA